MATYDAMAETYARRRYAHAAIVAELIACGGVNSASFVLELGAGTGNHIRALDEAAGCRTIGLELSRGMLARAQAEGGKTRYVNGDACALPFAEDSFDLVFSVEIIHHLTRPEAYFLEAFRVLKAGGRLITVTQSHEMIRERPVLSHYFPETVAVDLARYPSVNTLEGGIRDAGLTLRPEVRLEVTYEICEGRAYAEKALSCLHLIPDAAFERGLAKLQNDLAAGLADAPNETLLCIGEKPDVS